MSRKSKSHRKPPLPQPEAAPVMVRLMAAEPVGAPPRRPTRARLQTFFLREFVRSGSLADAAARTGIAPRTVQRWRAANAVFAQRYQAVLETRYELLEDAAMQRALGRLSRPVFHRGLHVATVERHNDVMLMRLLSRFDRLRERESARRDRAPAPEDDFSLLDP